MIMHSKSASENLHRGTKNSHDTNISEATSWYEHVN